MGCFLAKLTSPPEERTPILKESPPEITMIDPTEVVEEHFLYTPCLVDVDV